MQVSISVRIDFVGGRRLGPGKVRLLEAIGETGSISAAGRALGMSYKRAWSLIDELNRMFTDPLVASRHGGAQGGGAELTPFGRSVVAAYRRVEGEASRSAADMMAMVAARLAT
ncbi:MAG TPA: winged helix-turn-helix domain-containing protein [Geminicoccus sp.]|uniref:winged helix-turn-helix domain-containing protein n=1 Tax=Geminicoccus sp. TaxID=2024832 RepID=UPI002E36E742|nr:winged helix-turn-helix domain-containing protein [Geminicoccus sp.]HEX2528281.1 winged helix-turn-helix domain-containing protein [Geminicoccus sp.]